MKNFSIIMAALFFSVATCVYASDATSRQKRTVVVYSGFLSGAEFLNMNNAEKNSYACGLIDGVLASSLFGANAKKIEKLNSCVLGMSNIQIAAIIEKYLEDNPEIWHKPLNLSTYRAFSEFCDFY